MSNPFLYNGKELLDEDMDLGWYDYGFRDYDPQIGKFVEMDPLMDYYPERSPFAYAGNDPITNIDFAGLGPIPSNVLSFLQDVQGAWGNGTLHLLSNGSYSVSWVRDGVAMARVFAKKAGTLMKVAKTVVSTARAVDAISNVSTKSGTAGNAAPNGNFGKTAAHLAREAMNFVPVAGSGLDIYEGVRDGDYMKAGLGAVFLLVDIATFGGSSLVEGAIKEALEETAEAIVKDAAENALKEQAEKEVMKDIGKGFAEGAEKKSLEGVYQITTKTGEKYIGQSQNTIERVLKHFRKGGKLKKLGHELEKAVHHAMKGSTKLEREVYEQYLIEKEGIGNLINKVNPMGGRMELYNKMIDGVLKKFNLPK